VNPIQVGIIVDACTLKNFSVVGRMDVLEKHFNNCARWTDAIQREAGRLGLPPLDWLGPAMSPGQDIEALIGVDEIRRGLGATRADPATLHLGEAEAIYVLERYHSGWTFVSDDQPAIDFARRRGLTAIDSEALLADCYESGLVSCPEAFDLLKSMADAGRGVRVPPSHWFVCPPAPGTETRMHSVA
jgi:predicted nucleic acid-binding protein